MNLLRGRANKPNIFYTKRNVMKTKIFLSLSLLCFSVQSADGEAAEAQKEVTFADLNTRLSALECALQKDVDSLKAKWGDHASLDEWFEFKKQELVGQKEEQVAQTEDGEKVLTAENIMSALIKNNGMKLLSHALTSGPEGREFMICLLALKERETIKSFGGRRHIKQPVDQTKKKKFAWVRKTVKGKKNKQEIQSDTGAMVVNDETALEASVDDSIAKADTQSASAVEIADGVPFVEEEGNTSESDHEEVSTLV